MFDKELTALLIQTILAQEATAQIPNLQIIAAYQPTQQGVNAVPTAFMYKVGDKRYGFSKKDDVWDENTSTMVHEETQQYETTFQFSALATQSPKNTAGYTASDIVNLLSYILQSSKTIAILEAQGLGVLRVTSVRNPYFLDDRQRFEASPSFDLVVTHKQIITSTSDILQSEELNIIHI